MSAGTAMVGLKMKLFRNTGNYANPAWTEVKNVVDMKFDPGTANEAEVSTRGSGGFAAFTQGLKVASYEWDMVYKLPNDSDYTALFTDWLNGSVVEFAFADGAIGTAGTTNSGGTANCTFWRHECEIFAVPRDEPLGDKVAVHIGAKPCDSSNVPTLNTVS